MRIITGSARGIQLETLEGEAVRPTTEKTKEAIFSAIHFDIEGARVLDLFAGSGQLGLEALSRGAVKAVFTDSSAEAIETVKRNVKKTGFEKQSVICRIDYSQFLRGTREIFDIAFLDPPYASGILPDAILKTAGHMSDSGIIVCEHPSDAIIPEKAGKLSVYRRYKYGKVINVTIYKNLCEE